MRLKDKVAIVTGGSSGIGKAVAIMFAREGASVAVFDLNRTPREGGPDVETIIKQNNGFCAFYQVDVSNRQQVKDAVEDVVKKLGKIDTIVNVAGVNIFKKALDFSDEEFDFIIGVNLKGTFICCTSVLPYMIERKSGSIVNVASNLGLVGTREMVPYCASKAGVIGLTQALALEVGGYNVRVNALCPGATKTEINREFRAREDVIAQWKMQTPLIRPDGEFLGEPEDIAYAAVFLSSDESRYMTGQTLVVDGGWNAM
ncbi:MAG: SDR family oxidoreductase [Firmicutes bacterium]|nr:SDR family oxidoreductase [Bacillota bacterium]